MKKTLRTNIKVETERLLVISRQHGQVQERCEACGVEVKMIGVEEASLVAGLGHRAIFRRIESGRLHFAETPRGAILICLESLLKNICAQEREQKPARQRADNDPE